jgi:TonB family protein
VKGHHHTKKEFFMPNTFEKIAVSSIFLVAGFLPSVAAQEPTKPEVQAEPSCRYCPNPEFPEEARKARISSGKVFVEVTISEKGDVVEPDNIRVILEEPPGVGFAKNAADVVKKWKFNPATLKDGKPTKTRTKVHVQFTWEGEEKH